MCSDGVMTTPPIRSRKDLLTEGLTDAEVRRLVREGALAHVHRDAYATPLPEGSDAATRHRLLIAAVVPGLGDGSVLSHVSAAAVWGLSVFPCETGRVTTTRSTPGHGKRGHLLHTRRGSLADDEVVVHDGVRVTSLARTVVDLARTHRYAWGVAWNDQALRLGCPPEALAEAVQRARRRPGNERARAALAFADARAESPLESLSRVAIAQLGYPAATLQHEIRDATGALVARSDFAWQAEGLVGEADGRLKYAQGAAGNEDGHAVMREKRREQALRAEGWWVVRWGLKEVLRPESLRRILDGGFAAAPRQRRATG